MDKTAEIITDEVDKNILMLLLNAQKYEFYAKKPNDFRKKRICQITITHCK
jgi:hypothetical protein